MDDRQQQIQVGAGLQESRLNTDLINFLEKWGTWILTVVLVVVALYVGWSKYAEYSAAKHDDAFDQYVSARGTTAADGVFNGSPDNLLRIATEHGSSGAVAHLARLDAAEIYLGCARRGLRPGTDLGNVRPEDVMNDSDITSMLTQAGSLFDQVAADTAAKKPQAVLNLRAQWGRFAVATSLGDIDRARRLLAEIEAAAAKAGIDAQVAEAKKRAEQLDALAQPPVLLSEADLPVLASAPQPPPSEGRVVDFDGLKVEAMPEGFVPPGFGVTGSTPVEDPNAPQPKPFIIPPQESKPAEPASPPPPQ